MGSFKVIVKSEGKAPITEAEISLEAPCPNCCVHRVIYAITQLPCTVVIPPSYMGENGSYKFLVLEYAVYWP